MVDHASYIRACSIVYEKNSRHWFLLHEYYDRMHDRASDNLIPEFHSLDDEILFGGYCIDSQVN
jgi:hypothetical protein